MNQCYNNNCCGNSSMCGCINDLFCNGNLILILLLFFFLICMCNNC